jgi:hypothetical protein
MIDTFFGWDPGKTTGMARIDVDMDTHRIVKEAEAQYDREHLDVVLAALVEQSKHKKLTFVTEDFILFKHLAEAQSGSRMEASKVIGALETAVFNSNKQITLIMQPSSMNPTFAKWSGRELPRNHSVSHSVAAYNHVHGYLVKKEIIPHRMFR